MPKPPKSPLEKPSSGHSRRPSGSRRTSSSSEKSSTHASSNTSSNKHGVKSAAGHAPKGKAPSTMSGLSTGAEARDVDELGLGFEGRSPGEKDTSSTTEADTAGAPQTVGTVERGIEAGEGEEDKMKLLLAQYNERLESTSAEEAVTQSSTEQLDRLRAAMNAQISLRQQREKLAKSLNERGNGGSKHEPVTVSGKSRVSPINEERGLSPSLEEAFASPLTLDVATTSTESARTVRGGGNTSTIGVRTPSYPFPPMRTPRQLSFGSHHPFTSLSPTVAPENFSGDSIETSRDRWASGSVTPASTMTFQPAESPHKQEGLLYQTPNLYDLSLMLSSEPGLDAWWTTVVEIMREIYKADRVTLAAPADLTDIENVPWGQKATFNAVEEDQLSLTYLPRGSSLVPSSEGGTNHTSNSDATSNNPLEIQSPGIISLHTSRPGLQTRHSFTAYEETKRAPMTYSETNRGTGLRPALISRSRSYLLPGSEPPPRTGTLHNAEVNLQFLQDNPNFDENNSTSWETVDVPKVDFRGRVFPVLQALDYEADSLIDTSGVVKVLERGKVIALTRDYPYLHDPEQNVSGEAKLSPTTRKLKEAVSSRSKKPRTSEVISRISTLLGGSLQSGRRSGRAGNGSTNEKKETSQGPEQTDEPALPSPRYEEYEQAPPSPWSQSPAPSPAIRAEPVDNPFFTIAEVDEESFNPATAEPDFSSKQNVQAIGIDRSYTVLHIPLNHPVLSKPVQSFRLDNAAMEYKNTQRNKDGPEFIDSPRSRGVEQPHAKEKAIPVAILSIISPVIPYPSNLRHSLEHLSPHLATSFSLCQHYSNLEAEIAGLQRKRPQVSGFGAVVQPATERAGPVTPGYSLSEDELLRRSGGSMTSPSDNSAISRSDAGSPIATPGYDRNFMGSIDRRSAGGSPGHGTGMGEGYFSSQVRTIPGRMEPGSASNLNSASRPSKDSLHSETRYHRRANYDDVLPQEHFESLGDHLEESDARKAEQDGVREGQPATKTQLRQVRIDRHPRSISSELTEARELSPSRDVADSSLPPRRHALRGASSRASDRTEKVHTKLHSGGVDLATTFPSLPSRTESASGPVEMLPPSDRLKTLMLDTLPCHVFVALPVTGEVVWVNNRYLSYRGQTIPQLREDPWSTIHPDERVEYLKAWSDSIRTGQPFSKQVRIRRFDGAYRWFFTRAVAGKDTKNVIVQWYGSHMDIHDQHVAEVRAARQEESEASEANYRLLANLIPQIIFAASEEKGVIFANEQWLSYTGQRHEDALEFGFMDYVHPEDLAKCRVPPTSSNISEQKERLTGSKRSGSQSSLDSKSSPTNTKSSENASNTPTEATLKDDEGPLSRTNSSSSESKRDVSAAELSALARTGVIQVSVDSDGRQSYATEVRLRSKTGEYRWHLVRCVEVDNFKFGTSSNGSWFGACTDINDHKLLETKLKEAMDSKSKFLSNMSHEIRTPLIGISGMVSFLQDTILNEEQLDYTNTIQTSANSLLSIINDILDLSKVDAGMMKLSHEWFHTRSVIEEVNELVSTMAISKRLELNYVVNEDVPAMVKGDKVRIRQVLLNVIGNAIKFTKEGEVFSICSVCRDESAAVNDDEIMLEFSIVDTGRGFTRKEAELIFKPFSQIDGSSTRQHGGSGLGLVISRQLVELHGGKMEGTAIPGKGSTFTFTARFGLPTELDHPDVPASPSLSKTSSSHSIRSSEVAARAMKSAGSDLLLSNRFLASPSPISPKTDPSLDSPAIASSASSDPSIRSFRTYNTEKSSRSSFNQGLASFSEAARASGQDLLSMKLAIPEKDSAAVTPTQELMSTSQAGSTSSASDLKHMSPLIYSILVVCPQNHSREATTKHIEQTLPKDVPSEITPSASVVQSQRLIGGDDPVVFTHIVLNLGYPEEILALIDQIFCSGSLPQTSIVILSDPVQRQAVMKLAPNYDYDQLAKSNRLVFIYKPVKPSRFAFIFDPDKERDLSTDRNRSSARQQVANQKQNYLDVEARLGNKGYKILLVEDNLVNQKVLLKYLSKVGINVEIALDGVECTDKVFSQPHENYSLILCDLHMPRKDGYEACQDIRAWEKRNKYPLMPIIALSANVMAEVIEKCVAAGFNSYVTKPVNFKELSSEMARFLDRDEPKRPHELMRSRN